MKCPKCHAELVENAAFCSHCGEKMTDGVPSAPIAENGPIPETVTEQFARSVRSSDTSEEKTLWQGTYAGRAMLGTYLLGGLITIVIFALAIYVQKPWLWWVTLFVFVGIWIYIVFVYFKNRLGVRYRLTSHRFFHETGILLHKTDLIEVIDIDDITYTRTIIDRLTGVGTIKIDSTDKSHPHLSLPGIDHVEEVARLFQDARHEERRRRAVHIEAV